MNRTIKRTILGITLLLAVWSALVLASAGGATAAPVSPLPKPTARATPGKLDPKLYAAGKQLYLKNYCGTCHTLKAAGTKGVFGPAHDQMGTIAAQRLQAPGYKGKARTPAEYIRESIVAPNIYAAPGVANVRHGMPPFAHLSRRDLDALVYFLLQQQ